MVLHTLIYNRLNESVCLFKRPWIRRKRIRRWDWVAAINLILARGMTIKAKVERELRRLHNQQIQKGEQVGVGKSIAGFIGFMFSCHGPQLVGTDLLSLLPSTFSLIPSHSLASALQCEWAGLNGSMRSSWRRVLQIPQPCQQLFTHSFSKW